MDLQQAREIKSQLAAYARDLAGRYDVVPSAVEPAELVRAPTLAIGIAPDSTKGFTIAVRYRLGIPRARSIARRVASEVGPVPDVRRTGRIRALRQGGADEDQVVPGPPVASYQADGETGRVRPLRPGVSIAHVDVTAGTLGGFVVRGEGEQSAAREVFALSNFHVLEGSPEAQVGDVILQPGPADGGRDPEDRVGVLGQVAPLARGQRATVDAAIALLDDPAVDPEYPVGRITTTAAVTGGEAVAKVGRTTGQTRGRVTAIEMDDILVGYGDDLGVLAFDDQIEIESAGDGPFSRGGDSGSLVYREDGAAIGLLFAGSETGGSDGSGLTYVNPIDAVLRTFGVTLLA